MAILFIRGLMESEAEFAHSIQRKSHSHTFLKIIGLAKFDWVEQMNGLMGKLIHRVFPVPLSIAAEHCKYTIIVKGELYFRSFTIVEARLTQDSRRISYSKQCLSPCQQLQLQ